MLEIAVGFKWVEWKTIPWCKRD